MTSGPVSAFSAHTLRAFPKLTKTSSRSSRSVL